MDKKSLPTYTIPNITRYSSLSEILSEKDYPGYSWGKKEIELSFQQLLSEKRLYVIAEPGYGKTRLLEEMVIKAKDYGRQAIFIDLKKVSGDIETFIKNNSKKEDFSLVNSEKILVCLDALDEVKTFEFSNIVDRIKKFSNQYQHIYLVITCRLQYFRKNQELFKEFNFRYILLSKFSKEQVQEYFELAGISSNEAKKIMEMLKFRNRDLVIQTPRYLKMMLSMIKEKGTQRLKDITKAELLEFFIYGKLEIEDKIQGSQRKEIIKRILEKIALLMEIYQANILKKEELITILDDVQSNINLSFLSQDSIEMLYDRTVLKDNIDTIEFDNTEFQEYLAAKEIMRLGKPSQTVFDITVNQEIREIHPSWYNALSFLVDIDIALLNPLLNFMISESKILEDEEYHRIITKVDPLRLADQTKKEIFKNVFFYYQNALQWIRTDIADNLAHYFDIAQLKLINDSIDEKKYKGDQLSIRKGNFAFISAFILERGILTLTQKQALSDKLINFLHDKNSVVQRHSIFALGKYHDISIIKRAFKYLNLADNLVMENLIEVCININPNNAFSISVFIEGEKGENIYARYGLCEVKSPGAISRLLDYFITDPIFLSCFLDRESIYKDKNIQIVHNIDNVFNKTIEDKLNKFIEAIFSEKIRYYAEDSEFIKDIISLLGEKDENYIFELLSMIRQNKKLQENLFSFIKVFAILIKECHVKKFINEMNKLKRGRNIALWIIQNIGSSDREDAKKIYDIGKYYFKSEYEEYEKAKVKQKEQRGDQDEKYKKFKYKLEPSSGQYDPDVFNYYIHNEAEINEYLTKDDKERLRKLIFHSIFEKFDVENQKLTISRREGGSTDYTTHAWINIFGKCLIIAKKLNFNVSKYRKRIIAYIPFAYHDHLDAIFSLVPDPTVSEINSLLRVYTTKRSDDLSKFMPSSFIEACDKYKIKKSVIILKTFVQQKEFSIYDRVSALKAIVAINPVKIYLKHVFNEYENASSGMQQIAECANQWLIDEFQDTLSINWRINELIKKAAPFQALDDAHFVGSLENELMDKKFARPISSMKDPKYINSFIYILNTSFEILNKGKDYFSYSTYLWEIVLSFFQNLKEYKNYSYLKVLENYIRDHASQEGINWFAARLKELWRDYMSYIGKPQNISECIKLYNELKGRQYLDVSSPRDLVEILHKILEQDLIQFVESEGFYSLIDRAKGLQEDLIQKTLKTQLENGFLKRGFRKDEVNIRREEQLLDDKRTDFLISYGFIGPILLEIKRLDNQEMVNNKTRLEYRKKLIQYIKGSKAYYSALVIFRINKSHSFKDYLPKILNTYKDLNNFEVVNFDCIKNFK